MIVEVPLPLAAMEGAAGPDALRDALSAHYAGSKLVEVHNGHRPGELLLLDGAEANDLLTLYVMGSKNGKAARLVATIDNLCKGASGAAVQSLNIMSGLDEATGLRV